MGFQLKQLTELRAPLSLKLSCLRVAAYAMPQKPELLAWGREHLDLQPDQENTWYRRALWGLAAGETIRHHLFDAKRQPAALRLLDEISWREIDAERLKGGVILAAAHIGPPKFAMNVLIERKLSLFAWTNSQDMPSWLPEKPGLTVLDPLFASNRSELLLKSALHLKKGGILFGAPDIPSGARQIVLEEFGTKWSFSRGIPALARKLGVPAFLVLALWHGNRIRIHCTRIEPPENALDADRWDRTWIETYWREIANVIRTSPENLRFLRSRSAIRAELGV